MIGPGNTTLSRRKSFRIATNTTRRLLFPTALAFLIAVTMPVIDVAQSAAPAGSQLTVKVIGLRNSKGVVGVALFSKAVGFPEASEQALQAKNLAIKDGSAEVTFPNVPAGTYAVSVRHDENQNGKLDKNLLGIPKEGYGASNNPHLKRRAPKFEESKFDVRDPVQTIEVKMQY
jgi:uncharacterized protein (DUF2141 family)